MTPPPSEPVPRPPATPAPPAPPGRRRPRPRPRPRAATAGGPLPRWGWLEWVTVLQTFMPALLFIPGLNAVRTLTRIAAYLVGLVAWLSVYSSGRKGKTTGAFPARPWLLVCLFWMGLSLLHPNTYSPLAALGQVTLYAAVLAPAFWAPDALAAPRQMGRVVAVMFLCNAASATVGVGQVFYPERLTPPVIPLLQMDPTMRDSLSIETADGRKVLRPCGLTDTPGAAAPAGSAAALVGLCLALRPMSWWRRLACLGFSFIGLALIYFCQVRSSLIFLGISAIAFVTLLMLRGQVRQVMTLASVGGVLLVTATLWVARKAGHGVLERFGTLVSDDPASIYYRNRGGFVEQAFETLAENPLGYGMGWWGMIYMAFQIPGRTSMVYAEVMIQGWVIDGGVVLLIGYFGAVVVAMIDSLRIALTSRDPDVAFWGAVVVALNLSVVALCFSAPIFLTPLGMQFWLLAGALHAADSQSRPAGAHTPKRRPRPRPRPGHPAPAPAPAVP